MKVIEVDFDEDWAVLGGTERSQAAVMVVPPGTKEGGRRNVHAEADQWLYVVDGEGSAVVDGSEVALAPGILLLIEAGEEHQIRAAPDAPLRTINFYAPPQY